MPNPSQSVENQIETLFEIGRQKAAVVREFDRATFAQIGQIQALVEEKPELVDKYRDVLIRGERIATAANYLATLRIPGYSPDSLDSIDPIERDTAALFMSIFAPHDPEFVAWRELTNFDLEKAIGRLGIGVDARPKITTTPTAVSAGPISYQAEATQPAPEPFSESDLLAPVQVLEQKSKKVATQVLYDAVVLHLTDEARDMLLACKQAGERVTVGRIRKLLGEGHASDDSAAILRLIRQVNVEFAKNFEDELIQVQGGGWYEISASNILCMSTQEVLVDDSGVEDDFDTVEVATRDIVDILYRGKQVQLDHSLHDAILKVLSNNELSMSSEALLAHPSIKAFLDTFNESQLKEALRAGLASIQRHFETEYGIALVTDRGDAKLPNEYSRQEGILLITGVRRGRRYTVSPKHAKDLKTKLLLKSGEVLADNRTEQEQQEERLANIRKMAVKIYQALHKAREPLSLEELARMIIRADHDGEVSSSGVEIYTQLVFEAFSYLTGQQDLFKNRQTQLKTLAPREGDPVKYQIIDSTDTPKVPSSAEIADSMAERRDRIRNERDRVPEKGDRAERLPRTMDGSNRIYATHAIIDGVRVEFSPHEAAVLAILSVQPSKTPIMTTRIAGTLRNKDNTVTRGDIDVALGGLEDKLKEGWIIKDNENPGSPKWRLGKNVGIKTHSR